ncbi:hypothetical protein ElyMa_004004000 [Elysia marginata]|uniref:Uncharacterized protein n=1 Tax=Elysia marginata TaxID=1093978 RepID=A0AAV4G1B2_9GAST|nr:hypothetical protein ElyMa_004004000 [Elysia marginata]
MSNQFNGDKVEKEAMSKDIHRKGDDRIQVSRSQNIRGKSTKQTDRDKTRTFLNVSTGGVSCIRKRVGDSIGSSHGGECTELGSLLFVNTIVTPQSETCRACQRCGIWH